MGQAAFSIHKECKYHESHAGYQSSRNRTQHRSSPSLQDVFGFGTPQAIYKWQRGDTLPTVDNLAVLAALFGVKIDDILVFQEDGRAAVSA